MTSRYEIWRNSAIRKAAAPSVGGERMAPMPPAESTAPADSLLEPALRSIGQATDPSVTVVATPLPETVPSRKPAPVVAPPAPDARRPVAANEKSRKNLPAPENSSTAP